MTTRTYTDTERLDFMVTHSAWINHSIDSECCSVYRMDDDFTPRPWLGSPVKHYTDYREAIDACIDDWYARLGQIAGGALKPSKDIRRLADARNPGGYERCHACGRVGEHADGCPEGSHVPEEHR